MDKKIDDMLLHALLVVSKKRRRSQQGICGNVSLQLEHWGVPYHERQRASTRLYELFMLWPKRSPNPSYPVSTVVDSCEARRQYRRAAQPHSLLWDRRTKYGKLRWELLEFVIEKLRVTK